MWCSARASSSCPKYAHQSPTQTARLSRATPTSGAEGSAVPAPTPIAITDSPNAMITTRPCRSTKWSARSWKLGRSTSRGIANCRAKAAAQKVSWTEPVR